MNILFTAIIAFSFWLFLKSLIIPRVRKSSFKNRRFPELSKLGWLSVTQYLKRLSFIVAITYCSIWVFFKILNLFFQNSSSERVLEGTFENLNKFYLFLSNISASKFYFILIVLLVVFLLLIYQNTKKFGKTIYAELHQKHKDGALPNEPPSKKMKQLAGHIKQAEDEYEQLLRVDTNKLDPNELVDYERAREYLENIIWALKYQIEEENIRRRIIPNIEKVDSEDYSSLSLWGKILRFFSSKGLINSLYKTSRSLSSIGLAFILMSFMVASKAIIQTDVNTSVSKIAEIRLVKEKQKLDEEWQKSLVQQVGENNPLDEEEWTEEDEDLLNELARSFEVEFAKSISQGLNVANKQGAFQAKANSVRENIIKTYAQSSDGSTKEGYTVYKQGTNAGTSNKEKYSKKFADGYSERVLVDEPVTKTGKQFKESLKNDLKTNKELKTEFTKKVKNARSSFRKAASFSDVFGMMLGESFDGLVSSLDNPLSSTSIGRDIMNSVTENLGEKVVKSYAKKKAAQFRNDLVNKTVEEALNNVSANSGPLDDFVPNRVGKTKIPNAANASEVVNSLSDFQSSLEFEGLSKENINKSKGAIRNLSKINQEIGTASIESMSNFKHYFPGQIGADLGTAAAELSIELIGEGISSSVEMASNSNRPTYSSSRKNASRARSFKGLKGFRRIGGVLIGQDPNNSGNTNVSFTDISWAPVGNQLEIFLHRNDGKKIFAGRFDKDIVNQSLVYAADGRPITVTMVQGSPMPFLKILLHPTLVNTDLGCKAIGLDRLVDKHAGSGSNSRIESALESYQYQEMLYRYTSFSVIVNQISEENGSQFKLALIELESELISNWESICENLEYGKLLNREETSHLKYKPRCYYPEIVREISESLNHSNGSFKTFKELIDDIRIDEDRLESLISCDTEIWSGVRELPYSVDRELTFLKAKAGEDSRFFPLSFIRQVSYAPFDEDAEDEEPWEFPYLQKDQVIENTLWSSLKNDGKDVLVLKRMKSFTLLQRVFRTALNGDLGLDFPTEKLMELAKVTQSAVKAIPTPTWNSSGLTWNKLEVELGNEIDPDILKSMKAIWQAQEIESPKNLFPCN